MNILKATKEERIDKYLASILELSRSKIQTLLENELITVNGHTIKNNYQLKIDDEIIIIDDKSVCIKDLLPENIPLEIVYEDEDLLVINKESGMVVHPAAGNYEHTLVNALLYHFNISGSDLIRPGIVHRLDKNTSGLMLAAKNDKVHEMLSDMIKNREVERYYLAIVDGVIKNETGTIDAPIGRDENNRLRMAVTSLNSKIAITNFTVLKRFKNHTLIRCKLETGRTHQIRVHMAYIGHPITNDPLYNSKKATSFGQMLHSCQIKFTHPLTKEVLEFKVDPPKEFMDELNYLEETE